MPARPISFWAITGPLKKPRRAENDTSASIILGSPKWETNGIGAVAQHDGAKYEIRSFVL